MNDLDKFFKNTNLSVVIDHAGRAGNGFFLAIFDQHPEVLTCPWMHYTYSYIITEFENSDKINSKIAHKFWTEQSYFRFIYNEPNEILSMQILKFGGNPDAEIDRAKVRKIFDDYVLNKERLLKILPVQMRHFTEDELNQKYSSYFPSKINKLSDVLKIAGIKENELKIKCLDEKEIAISNLQKKIIKKFPNKKNAKNALKLLDDEYRKEIGQNAKKLLKDTFSVKAAAKQILKSIS